MKINIEWKKINKKTELRKYIKKQVGSTGMWDYVEIGDSGNWGIVGCGTYTPGDIRLSIGFFLQENHDGCTKDDSITMAFSTIERILNSQKSRSKYDLYGIESV